MLEIIAKHPIDVAEDKVFSGIGTLNEYVAQVVDEISVGADSALECVAARAADEIIGAGTSVQMVRRAVAEDMRIVLLIAGCVDRACSSQDKYFDSRIESDCDACKCFVDAFVDPLHNDVTGAEIIDVVVGAAGQGVRAGSTVENILAISAI